MPDTDSEESMPITKYVQPQITSPTFTHFFPHQLSPHNKQKKCVQSIKTSTPWVNPKMGFQKGKKNQNKKEL
jgi:hypothetical protein